eukprot:gene4787-5972_t
MACVSVFLPSYFWEKLLKFITTPNRLSLTTPIIKLRKDQQQQQNEYSTFSCRYQGNNNSGIPFSKKWVVQVICFMFLAYIVLYNIQTTGGQGNPVYFPTLATFVRVDQWWGMFAPDPPSYSRWLVIPGKFGNNTFSDLLTGDQVDYENVPKYLFNSGQRHRNFLLGVTLTEHLRLDFGRYLW